jgi:transcriptional regulator
MFNRELKKGSIELLILSLLENRPCHGYELGKLIESRSGGQLTFRIHSLYPTLCRMESRGLIKSRWVEKYGQRRKRFYRLTASGKKSLAEQKDNWVQYTSAINRIIGITHA